MTLIRDERRSDSRGRWVSRRCGCELRDGDVPFVLAKTARGEKKFASEQARIVGGEKDGDRSDVSGLTGTAERSHGFAIALPFTTDETDGVGAFSLDEAGVDGVDADVA